MYTLHIATVGIQEVGLYIEAREPSGPRGLKGEVEHYQAPTVELTFNRLSSRRHVKTTAHELYIAFERLAK